MKSTSIKININGKDLEAESGTTVLHTLRQNDIYIPTLCDIDFLEPYGGCRLCIIEIEGMNSNPSACTQPVSNGMIIRTDTPELNTIRKEVLKLILSEHPMGCLVCDEKSNCFDCMGTIRKSGQITGCGNCPKNNRCELQNVTNYLGVTDFHFPVRYRMLKVERNDPFIAKDFNICILCGRCVRVCNTQQFLPTLATKHRGNNAIVGTAYNTSFLKAGCSFCGACVEVCPTGSLSEKTLKWEMIEKDCVTTTCPYCNIGCEMEVLLSAGRVIGTLPAHKGKGSRQTLCVKGRFGVTELVNHPDRLKNPCLIQNGVSLSIDWEKAIEIAGERISQCKPNGLGIYVSPNQTNELMFMARLLRFRIDQEEETHFYAGKQKTYKIIQWLRHHSTNPSYIPKAELIIRIGPGELFDDAVVDAELIKARRLSIPIINISVLDELAFLKEKISQLSRVIMITHSNQIFQNPKTLDWMQNLCILPKVKVIIYPLPNNIAGYWHFLANPDHKKNPYEDQVSYYIGESPANLPLPSTFVIYQNIFAPEYNIYNGLILPEAAFTEMDGSYMNWDSFGKTRCITKGVNSPAEARPGWIILRDILQKMGSQGIDYQNVKDLQKEFFGKSGNGLMVDGDPVVEENRYSDELWPETDMRYLGSRLDRFVAGLKSIYPQVK